MTGGELTLTIVLALGGYLLGAVPSALLVARAFYHADIRTIGTGNIGAGNARRELGTAAGAMVMSCDMAKGFLPALAAVLLLDPWPTALVAFMPVLGHQYSIFLRGSGGKGIATAAGAVLPLAPIVFGVTMVPWIVVVSVRRIRRAGPFVAGGTYLVASVVIPEPLAYRVLAVAICVSVLVTFRAELRGRGRKQASAGAAPADIAETTASDASRSRATAPEHDAAPARDGHSSG